MKFGNTPSTVDTLQDEISKLKRAIEAIHQQLNDKIDNE